jgi:membrane protein required for colicin V production
MPIIDILIAVAILVSVVVGIFRGFVKEAISIAALLVAIWAALYFGPEAGDISENWFKSEELQMWFGRLWVDCLAGASPSSCACRF